MIEFVLKDDKESKSGVTLLGFVDFGGFVRYVKEVGEVRLIGTQAEDTLTMVVDNGEQRKR